jgi:hypothetical protein
MISRYAGLKEELSNQGWNCGLYTIEVGARGHIDKVVKDRFRSLFRSWAPPGHRSGVAQIIKYASWISLVCSFFTPLSGLLPVLLVIIQTGCRQMNELGSFSTPLSPLSPKNKQKKTQKNKEAGRVLFFDTLSITLVVSGPPFGGLVCLRKCRDDVDCSCESAGQLVHGPRIGFLGPFDPLRCGTNSSITSSHVARCL